MKASAGQKSVILPKYPQLLIAFDLTAQPPNAALTCIEDCHYNRAAVCFIVLSSPIIRTTADFGSGVLSKQWHGAAANLVVDLPVAPVASLWPFQKGGFWDVEHVDEDPGGQRSLSQRNQGRSFRAA
jgi:hypothetical protein